MRPTTQRKTTKRETSPNGTVSRPMVLPRGVEAHAYKPVPRVVLLTPELAEQILNTNTLNRPLRSGRVERYARDMAQGKWRSNGETIKLTKDGMLLDGQHRLFAVIESGVAVEMLIVEGLDADVMSTIDTGAPRSFGDVLSIKHQAYANNIAATLQWIAWYGNGKPVSPRFSQSRATHSELMDVYQENLDLSDRASELFSVAPNKKATKVLSPAILLFVYAMTYRLHPAKASQWLTLLGSGADLTERHPILQLRERLQANRAAKAKLHPTDVCALAIKAWNHFVTGKRTMLLTWRTTEPFPQFARPDERSNG